MTIADSANEVIFIVGALMIINFGKYKGQHIKECDSAYLSWLLNNLHQTRHETLRQAVEVELITRDICNSTLDQLVERHEAIAEIHRQIMTTHEAILARVGALRKLSQTYRITPDFTIGSELEFNDDIGELT